MAKSRVMLHTLVYLCAVFALTALADEHNLVYTGELAAPPRSLHPNIQIFELPSELKESITGYLARAPLGELSTSQQIAVALTLNTCAKLDDLPTMLQRMGLEQVTVHANAELSATCDGYIRELIPKAVSALRQSARDGEIPAIIALLYLLDPGNAGLREHLENQEETAAMSAQDVYIEAHRLASASIPHGNLYAAKRVTGQLVHRGMFGLPAPQPDGSLRNTPHRPSLLKAAVYFDALYAVTGDWHMQSQSTSTQQQLSAQERSDVQKLSDELIALWMAKPMLYDSTIRTQGYWSPELEE